MNRSDRSDRRHRNLVVDGTYSSDAARVTARAVRPRPSSRSSCSLMLIVIGGIIYFGIGLNYWLDMNRVANQGARSAAVNNWPPQCARTETSCTTANSSHGLQRPCSARAVKRRGSRTCSVLSRGTIDDGDHVLSGHDSRDGAMVIR